MTAYISVHKRLRSETLTAEGLEEIKAAILNPRDVRDIIDDDEKKLVQRLLDAVESGDVRTQGLDREDAIQELRNIIDTRVFVGTTSIWNDCPWNPDTLLVDNNGVTEISPWITGNDERIVTNYDDIQSVRAVKQWTTDAVVVDLVGGAQRYVVFPKDSGTAEEVAALIASRKSAYHRQD